MKRILTLILFLSFSFANSAIYKVKTFEFGVEKTYDNLYYEEPTIYELIFFTKEAERLTFKIKNVKEISDENGNLLLLKDLIRTDYKKYKKEISDSYYNESSPCSDKLFLELKDKKLDEMSDREYEYFSQMSKDCAEYQKTSKSVVFTEKMVDNQKKYTDVYILLSIISVVISLLVF